MHSFCVAVFDAIYVIPGEGILSQNHVLSDDGIRGYYKVGYRSLVSEYSRMGILDQSQRERLDEWVTQDQHEDNNTAEYRLVLQELKLQADGKHVQS